jgi:hypothetical protein
MAISINFVFVALGFCSVSVGIFLSKRKKLFFPLLALGLVLFMMPFARIAILTSNAYDWTIIVNREFSDTQEPKVIFVRDIEWVTDYEKLKRRRGDLRPFFLNEETTGKERHAKGYIPLAIEAHIVYGSLQYNIYRDLRGLEAGSYTFILTFNEKDVGTWDVVPTGDIGD